MFLREAYGPGAAFLCGWSLFTVARTAQAAWLAVVFSIYLGYFVPLGNLGSKLLSVAVLAAFAWVNYRGVKFGMVVQNSFTLAKVAGLLIIIGAPLILGGHVHPAAPATAAGVMTLSSFGVALISCLLGYDGWVQLTFVVGEICSP